MTKTYQYPAIFVQDEDKRFVVSFPDLPEALTDGKDIDEAKLEAEGCLAEAIQARINDGEEIPAPSPIGAGLIAVKAKVLAIIDGGTA